MNSSTLLILAVGIAIVGYGIYEYVRFTGLIAVGRNLAAQAQPFSQNSGKSKTVLVVGDSTAVGVGSAPENSVAGRIARELDVDVENKAVSGAELHDVVAQIAEASRSTYDLILIHAGANDVIQRTPLSRVRTDTEALISEASNKSQHIALLTAGDIGEAPIWPLPLKYFFSHRTREVREIIKEVVESNGSLYIDIYSHDMNFRDDPDTYYAPDYLHLSGEGYKKWFEFIVGELERKWPSMYERI